jgi:hypothetical protein
MFGVGLAESAPAKTLADSHRTWGWKLRKNVGARDDGIQIFMYLLGLENEFMIASLTWSLGLIRFRDFQELRNSVLENSMEFSRIPEILGSW